MIRDATERELAVGAVVDALWKMMREATINFLPSPLEQNKQALRDSILKLLETK